MPEDGAITEINADAPHVLEFKDVSFAYVSGVKSVEMRMAAKLVCAVVSAAASKSALADACLENGRAARARI